MSFKDQLKALSNIDLVNSSPGTIYNELVTIFSKPCKPNQHVTEFLSTLPGSISSKCVLIFSLLAESKFKNTQNITHFLISSLLSLYTSNPDSQSIIQDLSKSNYDSVDPENLFYFCEKFGLQLTEPQLIQYTFYLILIKQARKAVVLIKSFGVIKKFLKKYNLVEQLVEEKNLEVLKILIDNDHEVAELAVKHMCGLKQWENVESFIKTYTLNPFEFPEFVKKTKKKELVLYYSEGVSVVNLIGIAKSDQLALAALIEVFAEISYQDKWMAKIVAFLAKSEPDAMKYVKPQLRNTIDFSSNICYIEPQIAPGPVNRNCVGLNKDSFMLIDNESDLAKMEIDSCQFASISVEYQPDLGKFCQKNTSILQISLITGIYIIDLIALKNSNMLNSKLFKLFGNSQIIKIGAGFAKEIPRLRETHKEMMCFKEPIYSYVDLFEVFKRKNAVSPGSLANLVEIYMNISLCKCEERSNWNNRPLSPTQQHYAALNSFICLKLWDYMQSDVTTEDIVNINSDREYLTIIPQGVMPITCQLCKSKVHQEDRCYLKGRCKICSCVDHVTDECQRFYIGN